MFRLFRNRGKDEFLSGPRLYLRPPRRRDMREWIALRKESRPFLEPWEPRWASDALTPVGYLRRLRRQRADRRLGIGYGFHIFERASDRLTGAITLVNLRRGVVQSTHIGYWIGAPYARQGYMTEAVGCVLNFCFESLDLHRVEAACLPDNRASCNLLKRCGFRWEGRARQNLRIAGVWQDHELFAILATDPRK